MHFESTRHEISCITWNNCKDRLPTGVLVSTAMNNIKLLKQQYLCSMCFNLITQVSPRVSHVCFDTRMQHGSKWKKIIILLSQLLSSSLFFNFCLWKLTPKAQSVFITTLAVTSGNIMSKGVYGLAMHHQHKRGRQVDSHMGAKASKLTFSTRYLPEKEERTVPEWSQV